MNKDSNTLIIAEADRQELFIVREFNAPRERVFEAFSNPEILKEFYAPLGLKLVFKYADFRNGGSYCWSHIDAAGNLYCTFKGVIHEIAYPERIIQTVEMEGLPEDGHVLLEIFIFEELETNRTKLSIQDVFRSVADRDEMIKSGFESGVFEIFGQLDNLLKNSTNE